MKDLKKGDYVLATKYKDGDNLDQWAVGFFDGLYKDRALIVDSQGKQFRHVGFRRAEKISQEFGDFLVKNIERIEKGCTPLWVIKKDFEDGVFNK